MKFIKKVTLENFQSYVHTELEFSKGLNVILGHSDSGKTAILRAIRWCLYNEPGGLEFMRKEASEVKVVLLFQNDLQLTRSRTKSINRYIIDYPDGEQLVLEGFGSGVPQEVIEATGIERIQLDEKESSAINYSAQLEGPFLLNMSDSVKAAAIGRLVGVNILDDTLRDTLRDKKQLSQKKGSYEAQILTYENQIKSYDYLDKEQERLDELSKTTDYINTLQNKLEKINRIKRNYNQLLKESKVCQSTVNSLGQLDQVSQTIESLNYRSFKLDQYEKLRSRVQVLTSEQKEVKNRLKLTSFVDELSSTLQEIAIKNNKIRLLTPYLRKSKNLRTEKLALVNQEDELKTIQDIDLGNLQINLDRLGKLEEINDGLLNIYKKYELADQFLAEFENLDQAVMIQSNLRNDVPKLSYLHQKRDKAMEIWQNKIQVNKERKNAEEYIHSSLNEFTKIFDKVRVCPLCHQPLDSDDYDHLIHYFKGEDSFEL